MGLRDLFQALTVVFIWGMNVIAIKTAVAEVPAIALTFVRFAVTAVILIPFFRLSLRDLKRIMPICLVMGVGHFCFFFIGLQGADAATVAILLQLGAPFSCLFAVLFLKDKIGNTRIIALVMAFAGSSLLAGDPQGGTLLAMAATVLCAACWAWSNILIKDISDIPPLAIMGWMGVFACPVLAPMSAIMETSQLEAILTAPLLTWVCLTFTILGSSILAYHLWYRLVGRLPVSHIAPFALLAPVISVIASVMILNEDLSTLKIVGGILTLIGVGIIQIRSTQKKEKAA